MQISADIIRADTCDTRSLPRDTRSLPRDTLSYSTIVKCHNPILTRRKSSMLTGLVPKPWMFLRAKRTTLS